MKGSIRFIAGLVILAGVVDSDAQLAGLVIVAALALALMYSGLNAGLKEMKNV